MPKNRRVSPFGNPRIKVYSQLPRAYRSVSRPSSPLGAKASTKCTFIAWNIICTETNLHRIIKFSVWWLVKLFQKALNMLLEWWRWTGSNRWPPACKAGALPTELHPRYKLSECLRHSGRAAAGQPGALSLRQRLVTASTRFKATVLRW